jgi:RNA polymerase sigma-70 factor (ECF subfamily)
MSAEAASLGRPADQIEEEALIRRVHAGENELFYDLVRPYERRVYAAAFAILRNEADAEDAAQEAFVVAWQKLPGFRGDSLFRTWLLTIVWRKALDRRRQRRLWWSRTETPRADALFDSLEALAGDAPDPERPAVSRDQAQRVRDEILRLSPKLRDTLLLASTGEHTYPEIATMIGVPRGTVKWRVAEARRLVLERPSSYVSSSLFLPTHSHCTARQARRQAWRRR